MGDLIQTVMERNKQNAKHDETQIKRPDRRILYQHRYVPTPGYGSVIVARCKTVRDVCVYGRMTIAIERLSEEQWQAAIAWCAPGDQFVRARGRAIAGGALRHGRSRLFWFQVFLTQQELECLPAAVPGMLVQRAFQRAAEIPWERDLIPSWAPAAPPDPTWVPPGVKPRTTQP